MKKCLLILLSFLAAVAVCPIHADSALLTNPYNGHTYQRFDTPLNFRDALDQCEILKGDLAAITSLDENTWVTQNLSATESWLGGTNAPKGGTGSGSWRWITRHDNFADYNNWGTNEPSTTQGDNYLLIKPDGFWYAVAEGPHSYICEFKGKLRKTVYSQVIMVPDVNGNGQPEYALLGANSIEYTLLVIDSATGSIISDSSIHDKAGYTVNSLTVAGTHEVAILLTKNQGKKAVLQIQDTLTGAVAPTPINLPHQ